MTKLHLNTLWPATVGFDRFFHDVEALLDRAETQTQFPPHNIVKIDNYNYVIELAIAGFSKKEVSIALDNNILQIDGEKAEDDKREYLHKGIGTRSFRKTIKLAETVEVLGAEFVDGILRIALQNVIPESKKARFIDINDSLPELIAKEKQLLTE